MQVKAMRPLGEQLFQELVKARAAARNSPEATVQWARATMHLMRTEYSVTHQTPFGYTEIVSESQEALQFVVDQLEGEASK